MPFERVKTGEALARLAGMGVYVGTSSWKYPGWREQLYESARYEYRGKFAVSRFEKNCLREYAEVFKTVCVDAAYYTFPKAAYLEGLVSQVPADFRFGLKVTDEITVKKFPNLPRFGERAGQANRNFLNADLFKLGFLNPCQAIRANLGLLIFEFSRFHARDFAHGRDFVAALDAFLGQLPRGWPYGIEIRNAHWLRPGYFECLARHGVTHVFNSWTEMPEVSEQMALPDGRSNPDLLAARFLLKAGRKYAEAVEAFQPYEATREVNDEARGAGGRLIKEGRAHPNRQVFIFVNNRLEGNALNTITAMLERAEALD